MALPLIPIISALTTLGTAALGLFSRRSSERATHLIQQDHGGISRLADTLKKRMDELEESDVEQARLISELSKGVQGIAETLQVEVQERAKRDAKLLQFVKGLAVLSAASMCLALWALAH